MEDNVIRLRARTLGGNEVIAVGRVRAGKTVPFASTEDGRAHLNSLGWTEIAEEVSRRWDPVENAWRVKWDDQRVTHNYDGFHNVNPKGRP